MHSVILITSKKNSFLALMFRCNRIVPLFLPLTENICFLPELTALSRKKEVGQNFEMFFKSHWEDVLNNPPAE